MCGIVGVLGREAAAPRIIGALRRLEYRGYDSAGVATLECGHLRRRRAEGKLRNLERRLAEQPLAGTIGVAMASSDNVSHLPIRRNGLGS